MEGDEGVEVSSQRVEEGMVDKMLVIYIVDGVPTCCIFDTPSAQEINLNISSTSGNVPSSSIGTALLGDEGETDGVMLLKHTLPPL